MGSGAILWALANPKLDEREDQAMLDVDEDLIADRPGLLIIADEGFASKEFENDWSCVGPNCCGPLSSGRRSARARACSSRCGI
ncbi:hypothetical protein [Streptomyces sp. 150FB]|uniref:hypothetical protein n=1 Tax=Streptomyces sp. 150FB TaxID=1576605 RepID=UPI000695D29A|nr:hypothetical protein [Streptomyces sp. 150FB]